MPGLVWKTINGKRYLVLRWKKRINGKLKIIREVYIGDIDKLADIIQNPYREVDVTTLDYGISAMTLLINREIGLKDIIDSVIPHRDNGLSAGDYALIFIINRLSDPRSKNGIQEWMRGDFSSTIYGRVTSQGFWNMMERIGEGDIKDIMDRVKEKLISIGYDFSRIFVDASNFYVFMKENDMAKKGHSKKHRYDLNQVSYYIASNLEYIPFYGESYPGNVHDSGTFDMIISNVPEDAIVIMDRGYNSSHNISLMHRRKYIGSLRPSDNTDLMDIPLREYSNGYYETTKFTLGREHRIVIYYSNSLRDKQMRYLEDKMSRIIKRCQNILEKGNYDAYDRINNILEEENLNETILVRDGVVTVDNERLNRRIERMGKTVLFTNITEMKAQEIIDLYKKRNRVEHCFRTINSLKIAFPVYHWTPQKIRVHMFLSHLAYLFLSLMRLKMKEAVDLYLITTAEVLSTIKIVYLRRGKYVEKRLVSSDERAKKVMEKIDLLNIQ
jgi:transposase